MKSCVAGLNRGMKMLGFGFIKVLTMDSVGSMRRNDLEVIKVV
jgi:hypothetical protein